MTMRQFRWVLFFLLCLFVGSLAAQPLSTQVLQLLTRANTWGALQTYANAIKFNVFVPSDTTRSVWTDGTNLFFGNTSLSGGGSVLTPHNLLSTAHPDTLAGSPLRGSVIVSNATPRWSALAVGAAGTVVGSDGTDTLYRTLAQAGIAASSLALTAGAGLTGGGDLTASRSFAVGAGTGITVNADDVALTVPVTAVLGGTGQTAYVVGDLLAADTTTSLSRVAAVASGFVLCSAGVSTLPAWCQFDLANATGNLAVARLNSGTGASATTFWRGDGTWGTPAGTATGTVTSVALSLPAILTVSGSPVTGAGTLTATLATQTANRVWAGPTTGAAAAPTFRALVTADFPVTGVAAGTYASVTVDTSGRVTAATTTQAAATTLTGQVPVANGGTGQASIGDDNIFVGSAATTVAATTLPNCVAASCWGVGYTQATNLFAAITSRTVIDPIWLDSGYCQNATVVLGWSTPTANPGVGACVTGSNTQKLVVDFADGANTLSIQRQLKLPSDFTSTVDVNLWWYTTATSGDVVWQVATACVGNTETGDPSFNTASTVTDTAQGTTNQYNLATITGLTTTGCAAGEVLYLRVFRDPTAGGDTLSATARLVGVELVLRRAI